MLEKDDSRLTYTELGVIYSPTNARLKGAGRMKRTWMITGLSNGFGQRLIQNLIKKGQQATNTARQELTVNSKNQGRVDVLINLR